MKVHSNITPELLAQAEEQLFDIIFQQRNAFNQRWRAGGIYRQGIAILRGAGLLLSAAGMALCLYLFWRTPAWCGSHVLALALVFVFLAFFALFYFLPRMQPRFQQQLDMLLEKSCRRQAAQCVAAARQQLPFIAEYLIENGKITYSRTKDGKTTAVWTRKLDGVAFQRKYGTLIYKRPTGFVVRMVILHEDAALVAAALQEQGVAMIS